MSEGDVASFDDVEMSREGMRLLLCNDWKAAEDLFNKYKYVSIGLSKGRKDSKAHNELTSFWH